MYKKITKLFLFLWISLFSTSLLSSPFISLDKSNWSNLKNYVSFNKEKNIFEIIVNKKLKKIYIKDKKKIIEVKLDNKKTKVSNFNIIIHKKNVLFVSEGATGSGLSWFDPMGDIQKAINKQSERTEKLFKVFFKKLYPEEKYIYYGMYIDEFPEVVKERAKGEVWVKKGVYIPRSSPNKLYREENKINNPNKLKHFALKRFISLIGAFEGFEVRKKDRELKNIKNTILSGKINKNENVYHVLFHHLNSRLQGLENSSIDGFTIKNGKADHNDIFMHSNGGAMLNIADSEDTNIDSKIKKMYKTLTIKNCIFENNYAKNAGGAIYNSSYLPYIKNCIFINNMASKGGAIYTTKASNEDAFYVHEYFLMKKMSESFESQDSATSIKIKRIPTEDLLNTIYPWWVIQLYNILKEKILEIDIPEFSNEKDFVSFFNTEFKELKTKILNSFSVLKKRKEILESIQEKELRIKNCRFIKNNSTNYGGAIYNNNLYFSISNSSFKENYSCLGGAICNNNCNNIDILNSEIKNSYFENNSSEGPGTCIYSKVSLFLNASEGTIVVSDCNMKNNYGIYANSSEIYLENSKTKFINTKITEDKDLNEYRIIAKKSPIKYNNLDIEKGKKFIEKENGEIETKKHKEKNIR